MNDLAIYGAEVAATAELGWYALKGFALKNNTKYSPAIKEQKIFVLLPFPLDLVYIYYKLKQETVK